MRWTPEGRCELWTGERWVDLERDVLKPLAWLMAIEYEGTFDGIHHHGSRIALGKAEE